MSSRKDGRVEPGMPLRQGLSARAWNRAQEAADLVLGATPGVVAGPIHAGQGAYSAVHLKNNTTGSVALWGVMAIGGLEITPGTTGPATEQFQRQPILSGGLPTGGTAWVVAVEPIAAGKIGRAAVAGVVQAKVNVTDAGHGFATAKDGDLTQLASASSGEAQILWKESGTGANKWALLRFGVSSGASIRLGKVTGMWTKGATASVTQWKGDGSAAVSGPVTFVAVNRAQTVTGPTGGYWVGCELIDSTWHLEWAECT